MQTQSFKLWDFDLNEMQSVEAKKEGKAWMALCPWHADTNPSLQIYLDQKRYFCHGCQRRGKFYDSDFASKTKDNLKLESVFDYRDENGKEVFQALRFSPKTFRVRRKNPNFKYGDEERTRWIWNLEGVEPLLYCLPELIKGADPVYIVEGEKHVERLLDMGLTSTCNPFGAGKWRPEFNKYLKDRELIILCDNDQPGLEHGSLIASSNFKTAKSIRMPVLPGLQEKGDIIDYLKNGGTKENLLEIVEATPFYQPDLDPNKLHYKITTIQEILNYPEPQYLIEKILMKETLNIIASYAGVGKSVVALSIAKAIMTGKPLWDKFSVFETGSALLVDEETPRPFLKERIRGMKFDKTLPFKVIHFQGVKIDSDEGMEALNEAIDKIKPKVLIIDSFIRIHSQDENKTKDMATVTERLRKIVNRGIIVILIAHHGKGEDRPLTERLRGVSEIPAGVDIEYSLVDKSDGEAAGEKIVEFRSVKTRTRPVEPIRLKMTFPENQEDEITVKHDGSEAENILSEIVSALAEKEIDGQPVSEFNPAKTSDLEGWLKDRRITFTITALRRVLKTATGKEIFGKEMKGRGHPWVYWLPVAEFNRREVEI